MRERDGFQCTFVSKSGRRCSAHGDLEFDHMEPVARGGKATVENLRLRCRTHNQFAAERTFGGDFMKHKREKARREAETRVRQAAVVACAKPRAAEVVPWLQSLGIRADQARRAAERCESIPDAPLEERVKLALRCFGPRTAKATPQATCSMPSGPGLP